MIRLLNRNIFRLLFLVFFQVAILNKIELGGIINPYLYVLFILLLPFETPKWLLLVVAFVCGLLVDMFSETAGLHSAACVLMAFCRPGILKIISSKQDYEAGMRPIIHDLGFKWFFSYSLLLVVIHHFLLFYLEVFSFYEFFQTFFRMLLSIIFTLALIILSQYIMYRPNK
ncbi:MAG: hypothetical protein ABR968_01790 [Bacteroidales bacterium]|jgi:rod shape-determining protein MreD